MANAVDHFEMCKEIAQKGVDVVASDFKKPDDDFMPVFVYIDGGGKGIVVGIDNSADDDEHAEVVKNRVARYIEAQLRRDRAIAACLLMSVWKAQPPEGATLEQAERGDFRPRQMPNRQEVLWLQVTDGNRYEVYEAPLIRHAGAPPTVGAWEALPEFVKNSSGRFQLHRIFRRAVGL